MEGPPLPHTRAGIVLSVRAPPGVSSPPVLPQERGTCGPDALLPGGKPGKPGNLRELRDGRDGREAELTVS